MSSIRQLIASPLFRSGAVFFVLLLFNLDATPNLHYGVENAIEASFLWSDEGRQIRMLENIQNTGSLKLLQVAYTAFYINLSYLFSWVVEGGAPISPKSFAYGSKWVSLISMNLYLLVGFGFVYRILSSFSWALFALILLASQSLNLLFATRMHPEATMILFVALALYCATFFFLHASSKYWWLMIASVALAIGSKPLVVFLIPWGALILGMTLWKHRIYNFRRIMIYIVGGALLFAFVFTMASPYQVLNLPEWVAGLRSEEAYSAGKWAGRSGWGWFKVIPGDTFLGIFYSLLFCIALIVGFRHLHKVRKQEGWAILGKYPETFFLMNLSWILVGNGYIFLTSRAFIERYLIHTHFSFIMIIILGIYWGLPALKPPYKRGVIAVGMILILAGIQGQWRLVERDKNRRSRIDQELLRHRKFARELPQLIPQNAKILYSRQIYISPQDFPLAERVSEFINVPLLKKEGIEYLIVNRNGRPGMKQIGSVPVTEREFQIQKSIRFWQALEKNGVGGLFSVVRDFPEIEVTIYQNKPALIQPQFN